jgi:23S rRNA (guanosine2251-2'-O)-methyltransferase
VSEKAILEGVISVQAALASGSRAVHQIYIQKGKENLSIHTLIDNAERRGVRVERVLVGEIEARASGRSHGGVLAEVGPRIYQPLSELLGAEQPFLVMLDGIEDPFNFGQAIRALYAAGAEGLVVRPRNWMSAAGVVARSSAGASEWIPTGVAETAQEAADFFREQGLKIACTTRGDSISIYEADLSSPLFVLIGGERRGVTRAFRDQADLRLEIPYGRRFRKSLGAAAASAVLGFEVMRQRMASS